VAKSKADEYRAKALECDAFAHAARDPFIQEQMLRSRKSGGARREVRAVGRVGTNDMGLVALTRAAPTGGQLA
jgi:hypothetical protein